MRIGRRLWVAFLIALTTLAVYMLLAVLASMFWTRKGEMYGLLPPILILSALIGPILGVIAGRNSIRAIGANSVAVALGWVGGVLIAFGLGIALRLLPLGMFLRMALYCGAPFAGAFLATFITKGRMEVNP